MLNSAISITENPAPYLMLITFVAGNPVTITIKSPVPNNLGLVIINSAFIYNKNFTIISITKNPVLRNSMLTAVDVVFIYDTGNTTKNPALLIFIITKATNNLYILGIDAIIIDKPSSFLAKVTNFVSVPNISSNNTIIDDLMRITRLPINNVIFTVKLSNTLAYNSLAASSA